MNLFLDTSVLLAASGSESGASREIFRRVTTSSPEIPSRAVRYHPITCTVSPSLGAPS